MKETGKLQSVRRNCDHERVMQKASVNLITSQRNPRKEKHMRNLELPGRSPVYSTRGMAATSHPLATITAVNILQAGMGSGR